MRDQEAPTLATPRSAAMLWESDPSGAWTAVSEGWLAFAGRTFGQERGSGWTDGVHPDDRSELTRQIVSAIGERAPFTADYRQRSAHGTWRWIRSIGTPRLTPDGVLLGYVGSCLEVAAPQVAIARRERMLSVERQARVRAETLQALGSDLTRALTRDEVVDAIVRHVAHALGAIDGGVLELSPNGDDFVLLGALGYRPDARGSHPRFPLDWPLASRDAIRSGAPVFIASEAEWMGRFGVPPESLVATAPSRAWASLPLRAGRRVLGVLALSFPTPREFDEDERTFVRVFAHQCAQGLERARLFEAEREARAESESARVRLADVLDSITDECYTYDREWRFIHLNDAARAAVVTLDGDPDAVLGCSLWNIFPQMVDTIYERELRRAMDDRVPVQFEAIDSTQQRWQEVRAYPTAHGITAYVHDVSPRHRAEEGTRLLVQAGEELGASLDLDVTISAAARLAVPDFADYCVVDLLEGEGSAKRARRAATSHVDPDDDALLRTIRRYPPRLDTDNFIARVLQTGVTEYGITSGEEIAAVASDPEFTRIVSALGPRSHVCVALTARGMTLGALLFVRTRSRGRPAFDVADGVLAEEIGRRAGLAIDAARLYQAERTARAEAAAAARRAALLAEASAALAASVDADEIVATLARLPVPVLADFAIVYRPNAHGGADRVAHAHDAVAGMALIDQLERDAPVIRTDDGPSQRVLRTIEPIFLPDLTLDDLQVSSRGPHYATILAQLAPRSLILVPLAARGRALGALTLAMCDESAGGSGRRYTEDDLTLAISLAERAALALDSAILLADAERARAEAEQASGAKTSFLNVLSHELRTPIGAVLSHAQLIEMEIHGPVTEAQRGALARIHHSAEHLTALVSDLLNLTRIEQGRVNYAPRDVGVVEALDAIVALLAPQAVTHQLSMSAAIETPELHLRADPERFQQILLNLVGNAIKFTAPGGRIELRGRGEGDVVRVSVRDTGVGIPEEKLTAIFDRFVQVDQSLTRRAGGIGLGLAIARDLAHGMQGELTVESAVGIGSTFTLTLPRAPGRP